MLRHRTPVNQTPANFNLKLVALRLDLQLATSNASPIRPVVKYLARLITPYGAAGQCQPKPSRQALGVTLALNKSSRYYNDDFYRLMSRAIAL